MTQLSNPILKECAVAFQTARGSLLEASAMLFTIREDKLYSEAFSSFSEYCEEECGISKGYASKILSIYERYVLEGGFSVKRLQGIDTDKLYQATKLEGDAEKQLATAETWNRDDFKAQKKDDCLRHEYEYFCKHCWKQKPAG